MKKSFRYVKRGIIIVFLVCAISVSFSFFSSSKIKAKSESAKEQLFEDEDSSDHFKNVKRYYFNDDGTGLYGENIAYNLVDIQGKSSEELKKMIIEKSDPQAYGVSGKIDQSKIQLDDSDRLEELENLNTTDLKEFQLTLRVPKSVSGTKEDLTQDMIVYTGVVKEVNNFAEL